MRGGCFLQRRFIVLILWLISIACAGTSSIIEPVITLPIIVYALYIVISICNTIVFKKNGSILHPRLIINNIIASALTKNGILCRFIDVYT